MASSKEYLEFILEQLCDLEDVSYRFMMGEYVLYYKGKIFGGIYDNRFLVKPVPAAIQYVSKIEYALPYKGGKEMLLVDNIDDKTYLGGLITAMYDELPVLKIKQREKKRNN